MRKVEAKYGNTPIISYGSLKCTRIFFFFEAQGSSGKLNSPVSHFRVTSYVIVVAETNLIENFSASLEESTRVDPGRECIVSRPRGSYTRTHLAVQDGTARKGEVKRLWSQDVQEFQTFYQENLGLIYRYIYSKVGNREEAEDLTSQTFIKAVRNLDQQRGEQSMQKWLFQVARTTVADYWRAYYRIPVSSLDELLDAGWEGPADEAPTPGSTTPVERVQHILRLLPDHYREVYIVILVEHIKTCLSFLSTRALPDSSYTESGKDAALPDRIARHTKFSSRAIWASKDARVVASRPFLEYLFAASRN